MAGVGTLFADHPGRVEALGGVGRRHPNVGHNEVRIHGPNHLEQLGPVTGLTDDVQTRALQQARQAFAKQHVVVGDHHPYRSHHRPSLPTLTGRCAYAARACLYNDDPFVGRGTCSWQVCPDWRWREGYMGVSVDDFAGRDGNSMSHGDSATTARDDQPRDSRSI
jgi:hypothetical protein